MFNLETGLEKSTRLKNGVYIFCYRANILMKKEGFSHFSIWELCPSANMARDIKNKVAFSVLQCSV